jgi:hypothetical protein
MSKEALKLSQTLQKLKENIQNHHNIANTK